MKENQTNTRRFHGETEKTPEQKKKLLKRQRIIAVISIAITVALFVWLGFAVTEIINRGGGIQKAALNFKELINSYGSAGVLVALGIQVLQVIVSPIPGQVVEIGMGICYGSVGGALLCLLGSAIGAAIIMTFVKKYGIRVVELFISTDKINEWRFINSEKKLERIVFILFVLPGTPKDPLIFFFGLTKMKTSTFVFIQTIARTPAMFCTTLGGKFLADQNYIGAILVFAITAVLALISMIAYRRIMARMQSRKDKKIEEAEG